MMYPHNGVLCYDETLGRFVYVTNGDVQILLFIQNQLVGIVNKRELTSFK